MAEDFASSQQSSTSPLQQNPTMQPTYLAQQLIEDFAHDESERAMPDSFPWLVPATHVKTLELPAHADYLKYKYLTHGSPLQVFLVALVEFRAMIFFVLCVSGECSVKIV